MAASGRPLAGFFDGLKADPKTLERLRSLPKPMACGASTKPGPATRIAKFLGVGGSVHAQDYCPGNGCNACYVSLIETSCEEGFGGEQCSGIYQGGFDTEPPQQGFYIGTGVCGPVPPCPCEKNVCDSINCPPH